MVGHHSPAFKEQQVGSLDDFNWRWLEVSETKQSGGITEARTGTGVSESIY